jgi:hypothetical protein
MEFQLAEGATFEVSVLRKPEELKRTGGECAERWPSGFGCSVNATECNGKVIDLIIKGPSNIQRLLGKYGLVVFEGLGWKKLFEPYGIDDELTVEATAGVQYPYTYHHDHQSILPDKAFFDLDICKRWFADLERSTPASVKNFLDFLLNPSFQKGGITAITALRSRQSGTNFMPAEVCRSNLIDLGLEIPRISRPITSAILGILGDDRRLEDWLITYVHEFAEKLKVSPDALFLAAQNGLHELEARMEEQIMVYALRKLGADENRRLEEIAGAWCIGVDYTSARTVFWDNLRLVHRGSPVMEEPVPLHTIAQWRYSLTSQR